MKREVRNVKGEEKLEFRKVKSFKLQTSLFKLLLSWQRCG